MQEAGREGCGEGERVTADRGVYDMHPWNTNPTTRILNSSSCCTSSSVTKASSADISETESGIITTGKSEFKKKH